MSSKTRPFDRRNQTARPFTRTLESQTSPSAHRQRASLERSALTTAADGPTFESVPLPQMPPPKVQTTPTGDAEYTTARPPAPAGVSVQIEQGRDGGFAVMCQGKQPTTVRNFDELVSYLRTEFNAPADGQPADAGGDVSVDQAGATAQA